MTAENIHWRGRIVGVQPRIRLLRSFDERSHSYLGYVLRIDGEIGQERRLFLIGIGKAAQAKHAFRVGDVVSGKSLPVTNPDKDPVEFFRTSKLRVQERGEDARGSSPPWHGVPPDLPSYRARGHRRLGAGTFETKCTSCIWGCLMPVEMIIDHWNPQQRRYRQETFCYGPKSCALYRAGPKRIVPGRRGLKHVEEDWVDADATAHRGEDD